MKRLLFCLVALAFVFCSALPALPQDLETGKIDWIRGYAVASGYGTAKKGTPKPLAQIASRRAAKIDAMRNLLEVIKGVRIDSQTLVENFILKEDVVRTRVQGVIRGAQVISQKTQWVEGSAISTVQVRVCLTAQSPECRTSDPLVGALSLDRFRESERIPRKNYFESGPVTRPQGAQKVPPKRVVVFYDATRPVTGVVFSLQGYPFKKVVLPVVVTRSQKGDLSTVYSVKNVNPKTVRVYGIVRYVGSVGQAKKMEKLGDNVMIVPVEDITEDNMLVVGNEGARKVYETTRHGNDYLSDAKVAISSR